MTSKERQFWRFDNPIVWGIYASLSIAIFGAWLANRKDCADGRCIDKYSQFLTLPPNGVGDSLAGFAGALAFVWLIATVWLQGQELAEQRKELSRMADAQGEQVKVLKLQGLIFQEEQLQRRQARAGAVLEQRMSELVYAIKQYADRHVFEVTSLKLATSGRQLLENRAHTYLGPVKAASTDALCRSLPELLSKKIELVEFGEIAIKRDCVIEYKNIKQSLNEILKAIQELEPRLSEDQALRVKSFRVDDALTRLAQLNRLIERALR